MKRYFVFINGLKGPEGQIFQDYVPVTGEGKKKTDYLFGPVEVGNETLNECIEKFKLEIVLNV